MDRFNRQRVQAQPPQVVYNMAPAPAIGQQQPQPQQPAATPFVFQAPAVSQQRQGVYDVQSRTELVHIKNAAGQIVQILRQIGQDIRSMERMQARIERDFYDAKRKEEREERKRRRSPTPENKGKPADNNNKRRRSPSPDNKGKRVRSNSK